MTPAQAKLIVKDGGFKGLAEACSDTMGHGDPAGDEYLKKLRDAYMAADKLVRKHAVVKRKTTGGRA